MEIEEKINKIKWCKRQGASHLLLSTNDKTIKLWKVYEKSLKVVAENNLSDRPLSQPLSFLHPTSLRLPRLTHHDTIVASVPRRVYANAHAYHINSISINSDGETYISADDLRVNLWNLNQVDQSFNIVDIKPVNMEELTEVITAAEFHPFHCNYFAYSSSKGTIKLADMRENALCDQYAKIFEEPDDPASKSFFSEIISSISDVRFARNGRYILSRDYLTLKIWDIAMDGRGPVQTINIHDHLRSKLCDLYDNDGIFDKFECTFSGKGDKVLTGSYDNNFMIYPVSEGAAGEVMLQADKSAFKPKKFSGGALKNGGGSRSRGNSPARGANSNRGSGYGAQGGLRDFDLNGLDFNKKILHMRYDGCLICKFANTV